MIADRFVMERQSIERGSHEETQAIDLATTAPVHVVRLPAADAAATLRWMTRCDELHRIRHPVLAPLVDYGCVAETERFEAWSCGPPWSGDPDAARRAVSQGASVLASLGLTVGDQSAYRVFEGAGGAAVVPSDSAGFLDGFDAAALGDDNPPAIALIDRVELPGLLDLFDAVDECRPRLVAIWGPPGSGKRTIAETLARAARARGFIPVDARRVDAGLIGLRRSLFVVDRSGRTDGVWPWLRVTLENPKPHLCVLLCAERPTGIDGVGLRRVNVDVLTNAVRPASARHDPRRRVRQVAERACGLPGEFARALWPRPFEAERKVMPRSRVAESRPVYGVEPPTGADDGSSAGPGAPALQISSVSRWPAPDIGALRGKVEAATTLLAAGRHAPGLRLLRQSTAALARRGASQNAAHGALTLAGELIRRGLPRDALRGLADAHEYAMQARDAGMRLDAAVLSGHAWIDLARLDEAERVLRVAMAAARAAEDRPHAAAAARGVARCLFWRGTFADAASIVEACAPGESDESSPRASVARLRAFARLAVARGDSPGALGAIERARALCKPMNDAGLTADVEHTSTLVRLRLGDLDGVDRDARTCIAAARTARRPVRVLSALLMKAEADRRRRSPHAQATIARLRRLAGAAPPLLKARWELLSALVAARDPRGLVRKRVDASGLLGLTLFFQEDDPLGNVTHDNPLVEEVVTILQLCQVAGDEAALLADLCARVRRQLHAAAVGLITLDRPGNNGEWLVADGARFEPSIGMRALDTGINIPPHRIGERVEAAAVVLYGGNLVGALCARWPLGAGDDVARASAVLSMSATAAAPLVSAILARRAQTSIQVRTTSDLIGVTPAMVELRRSVERAAAAPFAVLIEGESGAGKELVARAVHRCGIRRDRAFCTLNCAALPDDLIEAELFGHARGSFTGAVAERAGVFEEAHGGTLFLDEVGELSPRAQAKLLRVIQEGELRRIGENQSRRVDVRVVSATNRNLREEVERGRFRLDLLYRLDVVRIGVPPLRERREDILALVDHFWADATKRVGSRATLASATRASLMQYDWPGNVRELQNVLAALAVRSPKRGIVPPNALPAHVTAAAAGNTEVWQLAHARRTFEEAFVRSALVRAAGNRSRAASELGVSRQGLNKLIARLGIE